MDNSFLNDPALKRKLRNLPEGEFLFKQGDRGNTLFLLVSGQVELTQKTGILTRLVDTLGPGEILGEKAALSDQSYRRSLSAQAKTEVTLLELEHKDISNVVAKIPALMSQILRLVIQRLDRTNELVTVLQIRDDAERLSQFLLFYCRHYGEKMAQGVQFKITPATVRGNINVTEAFVEKSLAQMVKEKVLIKKDKTYVLADENALLSFIPDLKQRMAA